MDKLIKTHVQPADSTSHTFLTGAIVFANLDYSGLADYALKAAIGGVIWMIFKLTGDYISIRLERKNKRKEEEEEENPLEVKED